MAWGAVDDSPQALGTITTCTLDTVAEGTGGWPPVGERSSLSLPAAAGERSRGDASDPPSPRLRRARHRWANREVEWSFWEKRHRRQSREGSGEEAGTRPSFKWAGAHESVRATSKFQLATTWQARVTCLHQPPLQKLRRATDYGMASKTVWQGKKSWELRVDCWWTAREKEIRGSVPLELNARNPSLQSDGFRGARDSRWNKDRTAGVGHSCVYYRAFLILGIPKASRRSSRRIAKILAASGSSAAMYRTMSSSRAIAVGAKIIL